MITLLFESVLFLSSSKIEYYHRFFLCRILQLDLSFLLIASSIIICSTYRDLFGEETNKTKQKKKKRKENP